MKLPYRNQKKSRAYRRYMLTGLLACLSLVAIVVFLRPWESLERRIAAVNTRHALPPEKNAAMIYDQLTASIRATGNPPDWSLTPAVLTTLIEASKMDSCWFPLSSGEAGFKDHVAQVGSLRRWGTPLNQAALDDVANGRIDAAAEKLHCLVRMGNHLRQQPVLYDLEVSAEIEEPVWNWLDKSVIQAGATEELLGMVESVTGDLRNDSKQVFTQISKVEPLIARSIAGRWNLRRATQDWWHKLTGWNRQRAIEGKYLRLLADRRGARLLVGLRRYHDANGRWPDSLKEIRSLVPEQALIDPYTEQTLVYRKEAGDFVLYSKGPNRIDQCGLQGAKDDDYHIWPRSDIKALDNLAAILEQRGRFAEAEAAYREALAMETKLLGREHPDIPGLLTNLARLLEKQNRLAEAEAMQRQARAIRARQSQTQPSP